MLSIHTQGNKVTQYIYGTGLIMQVTGGEYATYHYDFRGSTVAITDGKGKVTDTFTYSLYGKLLGRTGKTDTPFLFNGMYGVETDHNGLYCMRSRYYNPTIIRFINQDVVQGSLENAVMLNRYAYANGNPISYIDPFGTEAEDIPLQAKIAMSAQEIDPITYQDWSVNIVAKGKSYGNYYEYCTLRQELNDQAYRTVTENTMVNNYTPTFSKYD